MCDGKLMYLEMTALMTYHDPGEKKKNKRSATAFNLFGIANEQLQITCSAFTITILWKVMHKHNNNKSQ